MKILRIYQMYTYPIEIITEADKKTLETVEEDDKEDEPAGDDTENDSDNEHADLDAADQPSSSVVKDESVIKEELTVCTTSEGLMGDLEEKEEETAEGDDDEKKEEEEEFPDTNIRVELNR